MGRTLRHLRVGGLLQMGMVPSASPAPRYCSSPLPALQQLHAVSWVPEPSLRLQSHQPAPWSWRVTKAGGLRLSWHGENHSIDTMAGTESVADSFVGLGSLLQGYQCALGKGQQGGRVWAEGMKEHFLVDCLPLGSRVPENLFASAPVLAASVSGTCVNSP